MKPQRHRRKMRGFTMFVIVLVVIVSVFTAAEDCRRRSRCYNEPPREGYDVRYPCANLTSCDLPYGLKRKQGGCDYDDIDECMLATHQCDDRASCSNNIGSYTCVCFSGFSGTGFTCHDIDECVLETEQCDVNANCNNTIGSYTCYCKSGFNGTGSSCKDIDECVLETDQCDVNANCNNTISSYACFCKSGYNGTGFSCQDINECDLQTNECDANANCNNTIGSYTCSCKSGYDGTGFSCSACPTGWSVMDDNCYFVSDTKITWYQARDHCQSFKYGNVHLVDLTDEEENKFVGSLITILGEFWIGLNDIDVEGTWTWISGDNSQYTEWDYNQPAASSVENCASTYRGATWVDVPCNIANYFICKQK